MVKAFRIQKGAYHDSVKLMRVSAAACEKPGVLQAVAVLGTSVNMELLTRAGLLSKEVEASGPNDLILTIEADNSEVAEKTLLFMEDSLVSSRLADAGVGNNASFPAPTLEAALKTIPDINLALISIPGEYVRREAERALRKGLHCLIFSDNVPLEDEIVLKKIGREKGLLVMGPDCGTAHIGGAGLGFCNVMRPGRIGIVGAAGTGIQEAMAAIDAAGGGIRCALGTGGRDITDAVGGIGMIQGIELLAEDPETDVILLLGKPPQPEAMKNVMAAATRCDKPVVIHFVGSDPEEIKATADRNDSLFVEASLTEVGRRAVSVNAGSKSLKSTEIASDVLNRITGWRRGRDSHRRFLRGVYTGGTLCAEAQSIIGRSIPDISSNVPVKKGHGEIEDPLQSSGHCVIDLGEDFFTRGRPHPMIEPGPRNERLIQEAGDPETAVVLFDVVLGLGAHGDPAGEAAGAIQSSKANQQILFIASVTGTSGDPQGLDSQRAKLKDAGVLVAESHHEACLIAKAALKECG